MNCTQNGTVITRASSHFQSLTAYIISSKSRVACMIPRLTAPPRVADQLFSSAVSIRHIPIRDRTGCRLLLHCLLSALSSFTTTTTTTAARSARSARSVPRASFSERELVQHHRSGAELDAGEMRVYRYDVHKFGQLDPEDGLQGEELGARFFVELVDWSGREGGRQGLGHGIAQLPPEGAVVVHGGRKAGPGGVWSVLDWLHMKIEG